MIYLSLFWAFLRVGCFAFGGGYGAIPLIRDVVLSNSWMSDESLVNMIAISESTPGPIMVNMATFVGSTQGGILGAFVATFAVVLPSFVIILVLMAVLSHVLKSPWVKAALGGINPCIIGIILFTGAQMAVGNCFSTEAGVEFRALIVTGILVGVPFLYKSVTKKKMSPILQIAIAGCIGILVWGI